MANTRETITQLLAEAADGQAPGSYTLQDLRNVIVSELLDAGSVSAAGTNSGTATVLTSQTNVITTVASGTGVRLPAGMRTVVMHRGVNTLAIYPPTGGQIEALGTDVAFSLQPGQDCSFVFPSTGSPTQGYVSVFLNISALATSLPSVAGQIWNDGGLVAIS